MYKAEMSYIIDVKEQILNNKDCYFSHILNNKSSNRLDCGVIYYN